MPELAAVFFPMSRDLIEGFVGCVLICGTFSKSMLCSCHRSSDIHYARIGDGPWMAQRTNSELLVSGCSRFTPADELPAALASKTSPGLHEFLAFAGIASYYRQSSGDNKGAG